MKKWNTKRGAALKREECGPDSRKRKFLMCECGREKVCLCPECDEVPAQLVKVQVTETLGMTLETKN
jgi:hypothetical protein